MRSPKILRTNLLFLSLLSFVFISSSALSLSKGLESKVEVKVVRGREYPPLPILSGSSASFPILSAQSVLAIDLESGKTLFELNPDSTFLPASTTKIVTALVSLDHYHLDQVLRVNGIGVEGQKMGLISNEDIRVEDLLYGLLIYSANDAAEVLAVNYPGGREAFISAMNRKAKEFNLDQTEFKNPSGLDDFGHVSTARDLVRISKHAMDNPIFSKIVSIENTVVTSADGKIKHKLVNINELLGEVDGVTGVKTGWTENARENLVTYLERDGNRVMIALLGSQDRFGETKELINWIFENYEWEEIWFPET